MEPTSDVQQELNGAIEALYNVFARYPLAQYVEGCPCCVSADDEEKLHRQPLRNLTADELSRYAFKAMTTWGAVEDFKHFLPRLFELVTAKESITDEIDVEVLFGKLAYAKWQQWPLQEQKAVKDYLDALWCYLLSCHAESITIDSFICAYGKAVDDLAPYLATWANTRTMSALRHYFAFLDWNEDYLQSGKLSNGFWPEHNNQMRQVVDWATSPATETKMEQTLYLLGENGERI